MIKNKIVVTIKPKNGSEIAAVLTFFLIHLLPLNEIQAEDVHQWYRFSCLVLMVEAKSVGLIFLDGWLINHLNKSVHVKGTTVDELYYEVNHRISEEWWKFRGNRCSRK